MPDLPIEGGSERDYPSDMERRVRVLEEIAAATKAMLAEIRADQRAMRAEMATNAAAMRSEITSMVQWRERDLRITFGAIISTTPGPASLIAHTAHRL
jgi:hypothetical protein